MTFSLLFCTQSPFSKGIYFEKNEVAPEGSKVFSFTVDLFSEGGGEGGGGRSV